MSISSVPRFVNLTVGSLFTWGYDGRVTVLEYILSQSGDRDAHDVVDATKKVDAIPLIVVVLESPYSIIL